LLVWSLWAFAESAVFRIDHVVIQGNHRLTAEEVRKLLDGINDQTIFHIDLAEYRLRVLDSRWVADAALRRVFPTTVEVRVTERTPLAIARLNSQSYLVDATGMIIDAAGPQYAEYDLPIVDGLLTDDSSGALADSSRVRLVQSLLADLSARADLLKRVSQVDVSNPRNAVVLLDGEPARLFLGDREFLARLNRYEEGASAVRERMGAIDYYDLRFERMFVGALPPSLSGSDAGK
jgi:cell division protein FtsQ